MSETSKALKDFIIFHFETMTRNSNIQQDHPMGFSLVLQLSAIYSLHKKNHCKNLTFAFALVDSSFQSFHSDVRMEEDSNCDANDADDDMSTSTQCSIDDPFHGFDIDECLMNDGLPL